MAFQVPAILTSFSTKADGGASIRFSTNEVTDADFLVLKKSHQQYGWLLFQENPYQPSDIPTEAAENPSKTPSKRLRATLFVLWTQQGSQGDFEAFYTERMNKIIDYVKAKLDA
jgi:hypothetical protein